MSQKKTVNPAVHDQRNERHHRDLQSGQIFASQEEGQRDVEERADKRRLAGGPGSANKAASKHEQKQAQTHGSAHYTGRHPG